MTTRREVAVLAAGLGVFLALSVTSLRQQAATYDEGAHLPAGYTYLVTGDHRLNPEHPPLAKLIAAAPLLVAGSVSFDRQDHAWATGRQWELGRRFLYAWNDADRLLFLGRLPIVVLALGLCVATAWWTRARFGPAAGTGALVLAAFSPEVLAHGQLVTTDLALALFFFLSVIGWDAWLRRPTGRGLLLAGLALGAAMATKFSALVLLPVLALLAFTAVAGARERATSARRVAGSFLGVSLLAWALLWASYGFARPLSAEPSVRAELLATTLAQEDRGVVAHLVLAAEAAHLLPEAYTRGFLFAYRHAERRPTFLRGEIHEDGSSLFFPVSFALKTPVPLMLLVALALAFAWRKGAGWREEAVLWLPVLGYLLLTQSRGLNIGHRHLLPIYPFLFVAAARAAARAWSAAGGGSALRLAVAGLFAWYALGTLLVHPYYLSYFNEIAGGPARGYHSLVDSSLDWGQDLKGLRRALDSRGISRVKLSYFGSADPAYYGIDADMLPSTMSPRPAHVTREVRPGDILAVSATNLQGVYLEEPDRRLMARVRELPVLGRVGYSIFLFRADFTWPDR